MRQKACRNNVWKVIEVMTFKINIGIVAHVDAGKTTLTENILYLGGVIKSIGRVDKGDTQTDSMDVERRRGISVRAAATSFVHNGVKFNLIDTPGHVDFVAEVERALFVLDGVILVASAKEGLQSQTRVLMDTIRACGIPCVVFINKIDRSGAEPQRVFTEANEYMGGWLINADEMDEELMTLAKAGQVYPVLYGSALKGVGVEELLEALPKFLPQAPENVDDALSAVVFKVDNNGRERLVFVRLFAGRLEIRKTVEFGGNTEKITRLARLENGKIVPCDVVEAGDIAVLYIKDLKIGDVLGENWHRLRNVRLARPTLSVEVLPKQPEQARGLYEALVVLADEDPLLDLSSGKNALSIDIFGEVQMEILQELLRERFGIDAEFSEATTIYMEAPTAAASAVAPFSNGTPWAAGVGIRVEPLPRGSGLQYATEVSFGDLGKTFQNAVEEAVLGTCKNGVFGWEVTDAKVVFDFSDYDSVMSAPSDFRNLTPIVLLEALGQAEMALLEPFLDFELRVPENSISKALYDLGKMEAQIEQTTASEAGFVRILGMVAAHNCKDYGAKIGGYTSGQGLWLTKFRGYDNTSFAQEKVNTEEINVAANKALYVLHKSGAK